IFTDDGTHTNATAIQFVYTIQPTDNISDLTVSSLQIPTGGDIVDTGTPFSVDFTNIGAASGSDTGLVIDTTAPVLAISTAGGLTKDAAHTILGTADPAEAGRSVHIMEGAADLGHGTIDGDGNWSVDVTLNGDTAHNLVATEIDLAGN